MSSRVLVRRKGAAGQPIAWQEAGASYAAAGRARWVAETSAPPSPELPPDARQAAFREGEAAGRAAAQNEIRPLLERFAHTIEELAALRPRLREQAERDVVRLAVAIARRVVRRELTIDPQAVAGLAKAALEQLAAEERIRVRVHPEDEAAVRSSLAQTRRADAIEVTGDAALERGSAVFETGRGNLDASAETQLAEIERGLTDRLRGRE
ncbi:MAG: flagellar assembly protein FliH [Acidobacteriia bacterium]|nr:flagellar assembly protein FliH [Terriglobia bacterium]